MSRGAAWAAEKCREGGGGLEAAPETGTLKSRHVGIAHPSGVLEIRRLGALGGIPGSGGGGINDGMHASGATIIKHPQARVFRIWEERAGMGVTSWQITRRPTRHWDAPPERDRYLDRPRQYRAPTSIEDKSR